MTLLLWAIPKWNNCLRSIKFIQWYRLIQSSEYLCEFTTGENRERGREREGEQRINGVRVRTLDRNGRGVGQKWLLVKMNTCVFLAMQINTTNKLSIKLDGFWILQFLWCRNFHYHNDMFRHTLPCNINLNGKSSKVPKTDYRWSQKFMNESKSMGRIYNTRP